MAEFNFIATQADTLTFAEYLFSQFAPCVHVDQSPTSTPATITSTSALTALLSQTSYPPLLFITSLRWGDAPLYTTEVHTDDGRYFFAIRQRYGGPAFTWMLSRELDDDDGGRILTAGMLSDYPWYYLKPDHPETIDRPTEMSRDYRMICSHLRRQSVRTRFHSSGRFGPWLLPDARRLHLGGVRLGPDSIWTIDL